MISRTYICRLPNNGAVNLDIALENAPGLVSAPAAGDGGTTSPATAATGAYYELRGRPIVFPVKALVGGAANPAFVRRANLGWSLSMNVYGGAALTEAPVYQLSASVVQLLTSTEGAGIITPAVLADPGYGPTLRIINHANLTQRIVVVSFSIFEAKDDDRNPTGAV